MSRKVLKENAKQQLGGSIFHNNWLLALLLLYIESLIVFAVSVTGIIGAVLFAGPLTYGVQKTFLMKVYGQENIKLDSLFDGFKDDIGGTIMIGLMQSIFIFLWSLAAFIPGIVKSYSYAMSYYIKVDHPEYNWRECINASKKMMKGNKGKLFVLDLSFIGWYIIGSFVFGIGMLWVAPYHECTRANFYACLAAQNTANETDAFQGAV